MLPLCHDVIWIILAHYCTNFLYVRLLNYKVVSAIYKHIIALYMLAYIKFIMHNIILQLKYESRNLHLR